MTEEYRLRFRSNRWHYRAVKLSGRKLIRGNLILQPKPAVLVLRLDEVLLVTISGISTDPTDPDKLVVSALIQLI